MLNPTHAPMRYLRMEAHDRDIAMQGDYHVPGIQRYCEGGSDKLAVVCGTLQTNSGYGKRLLFFTYQPLLCQSSDYITRKSSLPRLCTLDEAPANKLPING